MSYNRYIHVSKERHEILCERFSDFLKKVDDVNEKPFKMFDPLTKKQLEELNLIREVSRELAKKKDEDLQKAARQEAEAEAQAAAEAASEKDAAEDANENASEVKVNGIEEVPAKV
ncbi:unnamed protein product [Euphydryas editha]|uniref:Uncharacterized protein n=1 Tax=Euphydryas editha TaxID=104508 RepID=A0AAU9UQG8_EUPED|nr:unnamed protein product [Euphydryas editha]